MNATENSIPVLVSACLAGQRCRYNGKDKLNATLMHSLRDRMMVTYCPEEAGGLGTPRPQAGIERGAGAEVLDGASRVVTETGEDVTDAFLRGARGALELAQRHDISEAFLKARSPSCGCGQVSRFGNLGRGNGVAAELLLRNGIRVQPVD